MPWDSVLHALSDSLHLHPATSDHVITAFADTHHDDHASAAAAANAGPPATDTSADYPGVDPEVLKLQGAKVSVDLMNNNNSQYYGDVAIGSNKQPFTAIFDTGSSVTWVPGAKCKSDTCVEHHRYSEEASKSFQPHLASSSSKAAGNARRQGSISYGTGHVKYEGGQDRITFCDSHHNAGCHGLQSKSVETGLHPFGMSTDQTSNPFRVLPFDGILGLSPSTNPGSILGPLKAAKALARNLLGFYFSEDTHRTGSVALGGVEPAHIAPNHPVHWFPITKDDAWQIQMKDIAVNGEPLHICDKMPGGVCTALVDTGSSLLTGPSGHVNKLLDKIHTPDNCSNLATMPTVSMMLVDKNGHEVSYPLTPDDYTLRSWDEVPSTDNSGYQGEFPILGAGKEPKIVPHCEPGVGIMDTSGDHWVIGNTFLRRYYSMFDDDNGLVGFVRSVHPDESMPASADSAVAIGGDGKRRIVAQAAMGGPLTFVAGIAAAQQRDARRRQAIRSGSLRLLWNRFL